MRLRLLAWLVFLEFVVFPACFTRSSATHEFGSYRIDDFLPGAHTVTAQRDGFQVVTVSPVFVEVNRKEQLGGFTHYIINHLQGNLGRGVLAGLSAAYAVCIEI